MFFKSWLRTSCSPNRNRSHSQTRFRPALESLGERLMPSTLSVTTAADVVDLDDGAVSLREAIAAAAPGDTISFDLGDSAQTLSLNARLVIDKNLTVAGSGTDRLAISGPAGAFDVRAGATVGITNLTMRDAGAWGVYTDVGAVKNAGTLTLTACTLTANSADQGGAIFSTGSLTVTSCTLAGNSGGNAGGAIYSTGKLTISGGSITNNTARLGGGVYHSGWGGTISGCTFSRNRAVSFMAEGMTYDGLGGGLWSAGSITVSNCTFTGNSAYRGGGIYNDGSMTLSGCTITANTATSGGGAYNDAHGSLTLQNSKVTLNSAVLGADLYNNGKCTKDKDSRIGKSIGNRVQ